MAAMPCNQKRFVAAVVVTLTLVLLMVFYPGRSLAENPLPVQTFYVPLPEQQIRSTMVTLYTNTGDQIRSVVALVTLSDRTIIYYDHWEDGGYEANIHLPAQAATQIWGDGNPANGAPPGYPSDLLNAGDIIALENAVSANPRVPTDLRNPTDPTSYPFDGGDKFAASQAIAVTRAAWPTFPGAVLAGAVEVYPTSDWGTSFRMPVGEDTPSNEMFEYVTLMVMAASPGTSVNIDLNLDGSNDVNATLDEGESYLLPAPQNLLAGARVDSSHPVQVYMITGDVNASVETRWYAITPRDQWGYSYYSPVSTPTLSRDDRTDIFVYNPRSYAVQLSLDTLGNHETFSIPARSTARKTIPDGSGAHIYSQAGEPFFAIAAVDANAPTTLDDNLDYDWGFSLVPEQRLGSRALVSWAPGADMSSSAYTGPEQNGSPVWVSPIEATTVYVDFDADPTTGPNTDPQGHRYNLAFSLNALERARVYDSVDGDQTGMLVYTVDGTRLAVAWGEDPAMAGTGNPFLDLGTTVPPLPDFVAGKAAALVIDADGDDVPSPGDTLQYTVVIRNSSRSLLSDISIVDEVPAHTTYVPGSTGFDDGLSLQPVQDDLFGSPFPLDGGGMALGSMQSEGIFQITFQVVVDRFPPAGVDRVINIAYVTAMGRTLSARAETPLHYAPGIALSKTVNDDVIYAGDTVEYRFVVTNIGDTYLNGIVVDDPALGVSLPSGARLAPDASVVFTRQAQPASDLYNVATARGNPCDATGADLPGLPDVTDTDDAFVQVVAPSMTLFKQATPAVITAGTSVLYELIVQNTGNVPLADVQVVDDRCSPLSAAEGDVDGDGILDISEMWRYTCSATPQVDTVNHASVSAQPSDDAGSALPGIARVSDEDTALVDVVAPDISLTKIASPTILYAGDVVLYRCEIRNPGDVPLANVTLTDDQCPGMTRISGDADADGLLDPGEVWAYTCQRSLSADTTNTATASGQPANASGAPLPGIGRVSAQDDASVDVVAPAIYLDKTVSPAVILAGWPVTYTLRVSNPGDVPLSDVDLSDSHCSGLRRLSGDTDGDNLLDPGETWRYECYAQPQQDVTNTAQVSGQPSDSGGDPLPGIGQVSAQDDASVDVVAPSIQVGKQATPWVVLLGDEVIYTVILTNTGDVLLGDVAVTDAQCPGLAYVQGDAGADGFMAPGEVWEYRCTAQPVASLTNTVQADGQPSQASGAALPGIERVSDSASAEVLVIQPSISLQKIARPVTILAGESVVYTCTVENAGDVALSDVVLSDPQCPAMTRLSGDVDRDGLLDVDESWVYRCEATLDEDTTNIATVSGQPSDASGRPYPGIDRVSAEDQISVNVIGPDIEIIKSATPVVIYAGDLVTYTIDVSNVGDVTLVDIDLQDDQCSGPVLIDGDDGDDELLAPGETWRYRCLSHPPEDVVNVARVSGQPSDDAGAPHVGMARVSAEDDAAVDVVSPGIAIAKDASRPVILTGESVIYSYAVTNTGDVPLAEVSLLDDHCEAVAYVAGDEDGDGLLDAGEAWAYTCESTLTEDTLNVAQASGQPSDDDGQALPGIGREVADASAFVRVIDPQIELRKEASPVRVYAGETVTYTYQVHNAGDVPLRDVSLVDDKCSGVDLLSGDDDLDGLLDPGETWVYRCLQALHIDTINLATATGQPCDVSGAAFPGIDPVTAIAEATVDVIEPECVELFPRESFEAELSTRWYTTQGISRSTARAQAGSYSLKMGDGVLDRERAAVAFVVPAEAEIFTLSFFWSVQSTEYQRGQDQLIVYVTDANGDIIAEVARLDARDQQVSWQLAARDLRPWADQAYGLVFESVTNSSRPSIFFLDNLDVKLCSFDLPFGCAVLDYYFHEEYNEPALTQWQWDLGSGSYTIDDSVITLRPEDDDVNRFPVFWTNGPFPLRENFVFEARFRYTNVTPYGTTVGIGSKYYYGARYIEGSEPPPEIENILSIHHLDTGFWVALMGEKLWLGDVEDEGWHTVQLIRREYTWILKVDGQLAGEVRSTINPRSLYIGNPAIERFDGDWTYLDVDYLRVTACMGQGIVQVWEPLVMSQMP